MTTATQRERSMHNHPLDFSTQRLGLVGRHDEHATLAPPMHRHRGPLAAHVHAAAPVDDQLGLQALCPCPVPQTMP